MSECGECQGLGFTQVDDTRRTCECVHRRRAKVYLRKMQPMSPAPSLVSALDSVEVNRDLLILAPNHFRDPLQMKWVFSYLLLKGGISRTYDLLNTYEVVTVKFGESERYTNLLKIRCDVLCLYHGYHESRNALLVDIVISLLELRAVKGLRNWLLVRNPAQGGPELERYTRDIGYQVVDLRGSTPVVSSTPSVSPTPDGIPRSKLK